MNLGISQKNIIMIALVSPKLFANSIDITKSPKITNLRKNVFRVMFHISLKYYTQWRLNGF